MVLKKIARLCKEHGSLRLWDGRGEQWLGDVGAAYSMAGAPELDEATAAFLLDLTEKDLEKIDVKYYGHPPEGVDFSDADENDRPVTLPSHRLTSGGRELLAVHTSAGVQLFNPDYLEPLKDLRNGLEWYERQTEGGLTYLVAASGWVLRAVIMPLDINKYADLPARLEAMAAGLRKSLEAAERREAEDAEQLAIDPETGEVRE